KDDAAPSRLRGTALPLPQRQRERLAARQSLRSPVPRGSTRLRLDSLAAPFRSARERRLVFIRRRNIVFAHGVISELVPHQQTAQVWMAVKNDAIEVKNLPLLELGAAPNRSERGQMNIIRAVAGAQPKNHRPMLLFHGVEVV